MLAEMNLGMSRTACHDLVTLKPCRPSDSVVQLLGVNPQRGMCVFPEETRVGMFWVTWLTGNRCPCAGECMSECGALTPWQTVQPKKSNGPKLH